MQGWKSARHPFIPKSPAPQYQPICREKTMRKPYKTKKGAMNHWQFMIWHRYNYTAPLQLYGAVATIRHRYNYTAPLQLYGTVTTIRCRYNYTSPLQLYGTVTTIRHRYNYTVPLQLYGAVTTINDKIIIMQSPFLQFLMHA